MALKLMEINFKFLPRNVVSMDATSCKVVDLLQNMEFPKLDDDSLIDDIIIKYAPSRKKKCQDSEAQNMTKLTDGYSCGIRQYDSAEDFSSKKKFCQDLDKRGLLQMLSLEEPEQLGFKLKWYRYSTN
ncbi:protein kinase [Penicillium verhagenii]|nr:protein kinase [Penicillium verhagenii]